MFSRLASALAAAWLLGIPPADSALRYRAEVQLPASLSVNVWVEGEHARLEILASQDPNLAAGTAMLTADGGENLVVLDSAKKEFFPLSRDAIARFKQRNAERLHLACDPIASEAMAEDPGPALAGYPTRHLRFHIRMTAHQASPSGEITTQIEIFEHFWITGEITQRNTDLAILSDSSGTGFPQLDEFLRSQLRELPGFILKRQEVATVDDSLHNHQVIRIAYEVTEVAVTDAPAALFEVPDGFHVRVPQRPQSAPAAGPPSRP